MLVPDLDRIGGYERQAISLSRYLVRRGVPVLVVTNNRSRLPAREERDGLSIHRLTRWPDLPPDVLSHFNALVRFLAPRAVRIAAIHAHAFTNLSGLAVMAGRALGIPSLVKVATERDVEELRRARALRTRLVFRTLAMASAFVAISERIEQELLRAGLPAERVVRLSNGVDATRFRPARPGEAAELRGRLGLPGGVLAVYVGRLAARKQVDVLLAAWSRLAGRAAAASLVIVGDGEERERLEGLADRLALRPLVRFVGEQADVAPYLRAADLFAFPSRLEGNPNALLEAMATGLPSVATRIGGVVDVVEDGREAFLVEPGDVDGLTARLQQLIDDPGTRRRLGAAARAAAEARYDFAVVGDRYLALYRQLARTGRPNP